MSNSPLATETTADETTRQAFEMFGREWSVPAKLHLQDHRRLDALLRGQLVRNWDSALAEAFLTAKEFNDLLDLNPDDEQMDELGNQIAKLLGFGASGNS